jgi:hypothetical protein
MIILPGLECRQSCISPICFRTVNLSGEQHMHQFWSQVLRRTCAKPLMPSLSFVVICLFLILVIKGDYAPRFDIVLCPHSRTQQQNQGSTCRGTNCSYVQEHLVHQLSQGPQCARVGLCKIGADNDTITGPVGRLYLWKGWNTRTAVDASSTQALTLPCLPSTTFALASPRIEPLVLFWLSKNPTGGFPRNPLSN